MPGEAMELFSDIFLRDQLTKRLPHDAVLYLLSARMPNAIGLLVKIGMTETPFDRYSALLTGVPLPSEMFWTPCATRKRAFRVESALHRRLANHHSAREWFYFPTHEAIDHLRATVADAYWQEFGHFPFWSRISEEEVQRYMVARYPPKPKRPRDPRSYYSEVGQSFRKQKI